ncbi:MAG: RidA family protein [Candidatus Anammoxibacter sp.]
MDKEIITSKNAPAAIGPYSQAVKAGQFIFVSGQIPIDPTSGKITSDDVQEQTKQVIENIENILTESGSSLEKVVKTTIYLTSLSDYAVVNETYGNYFKHSLPARATVEVSKLPKDVRIEIDAIALS